MSNQTLGLSDRLYQYLLDASLREPPILAQLRQETAQHPARQMQIAPEQGQFMGWLVRLIGARRTLDIGTFTGYSALSVALALPEEGQVIACDVSEADTAIARRYWDLAGVGDRIVLRLAPALDTLDALLDQGEAGQFDFAFIDADKGNYEAYFERSLQLVRVGGVIAIDNVLWNGAVADPANTDQRTEAIRTFNQRRHHDDRVDLSLVPIADGLTLARRRL